MIATPAERSRARLILSFGHRATLRRHAERSYPEECCGILIGSFESHGVSVSRVVPTTNRQRARPHDRFEISPEDVLRAIREAGAVGEEIVGYYHSHPDRPARPSSTDESAAWPGTSCVIVEVTDGRAGAVRSWRWIGKRRAEERIVERERGDSGPEAR